MKFLKGQQQPEQMMYRRTGKTKLSQEDEDALYIQAKSVKQLPRYDFDKLFSSNGNTTNIQGIYQSNYDMRENELPGLSGNNDLEPIRVPLAQK